MRESTKIALWSGPRNISTALMYSFANRSDTEIVDEPLFGYFLKQTGAWRPSREEVLQSMETDSKILIDALINSEVNAPIFFMKHMANHLIGLDWDFVKNFKNIILIRDPNDMLLSYSRNMRQPTLLDTAYKMQIELVEYLTAHELPFSVLNSKNILLNPEGQLRTLCDKLGIEFQGGMLDWEAGPRKEDGIWAKYWYESVHKSTGFGTFREKHEELPERLNPIYEECMDYYSRLRKYEMK